MSVRDAVRLLLAVITLGWLCLAIITGSRVYRRLSQSSADGRRASAAKWGLGVGGSFGLVLWSSGLAWARIAGVQQDWPGLLVDAVFNLAIGLATGAMLTWALLDSLRRRNRR